MNIDCDFHSFEAMASAAEEVVLPSLRQIKDVATTPSDIRYEVSFNAILEACLVHFQNIVDVLVEPKILSWQQKKSHRVREAGLKIKDLGWTFRSRGKLTQPITHIELLVGRPIREVNAGCPSIFATSNPVEDRVPALPAEWTHHNENQEQSQFPEIFLHLSFQEPRPLAEGFKNVKHMHISCM